MPGASNNIPHKPVPGYVPAKAPRPLPGNIPPKKKWKFSFRYWRQVEYFGIDQCDKSWFASVLTRFSEVSSLHVEDALSGSYGPSLRCHSIDWNAKNIPISRESIDWIADYANEEIEFLQFSISTGRGRVVGFFDSEQTFNIVLLDPMHNIQPSAKHNYQVRATYISQCAITKLSVTFEKAITSCEHLSADQQGGLLAILRAQNFKYFDAAVHISISDGHLKKAYEFARVGVITDLGELLEATIDGLG
ncbi:hypothetical protein ACVWW4_004931 [Bradyrhizobium sp. LB7.1]